LYFCLYLWFHSIVLCIEETKKLLPIGVALLVLGRLFDLELDLVASKGAASLLIEVLCRHNIFFFFFFLKKKSLPAELLKSLVTFESCTGPSDRSFLPALLFFFLLFFLLLLFLSFCI